MRTDCARVYLCVDVDAARPLAEGEWFVWQLVGLRVLDTDGADVGVVEDVEAGVGNDVLVINDGDTECTASRWHAIT